MTGIKRRKLIIALILGLVVIAVGAVGYKAVKIKKMHLWIGDYLSQTFAGSPGDEGITKPRHLLVMFADHFEPAGNLPYLRHWIEQFRRSRSSHRDADGYFPQHTFFYPAEQFVDQEMELLTALCREGYGEVELQLHHFHDDQTSLSEKLRQAIADFTRYGALVTVAAPPETTFGFVHGNWALDNSRSVDGSDFCGVNNEITLLRDFGCYADFTFPAIETDAQPAMINQFYYATDDPGQPKSYNRGVPMEVGKKPTGDLLIMHGILTIDWTDWSHIFYPSLESGVITHETLANTRRADLWVRQEVHVTGQPNWIFVKLYCHGAIRADSLALWGTEIEELFTHLETKYNDGAEWVLHYLTARETYNIARAAEAGQTGNPHDYRDWEIAPYRVSLAPHSPAESDSITSE